MSFALTSFFADGVRFSGPGLIRATQQYQFNITAAATDVDLDIGDVTGTFWTAAIANTTYGEMATQVLAQVNRLYSQFSSVKQVFVPQLFDRIQVASSPTGVQFTQELDSTTLLPNYGFGASQGETAYTVFVEYMLDPNILPTNLNYNLG